MDHDVLFEQVRNELLDVVNESDADALMRKLTQYQDPESAVTIYLDAASLQKKLDEVKNITKGRIEAHLRETGELAYDCKAGKAAYTIPGSQIPGYGYWNGNCSIVDYLDKFILTHYNKKRK